MSLSAKQRLFSYQVHKLIEFIYQSGWSVSIGHVWRSEKEQRRMVEAGLSKTMDSAHLNKLAIDLNFFDPQSNLTYDKDYLQRFGDYWEGLDPKNTWGGNWESFTDTPHFERRL